MNVTHARGRVGPRAACGTRHAHHLTDDLATVTCRRCLRMMGTELFEARRHRGYIAAARRRWPAAEWIIGEGQYASVAYCDTTTIMLFRTLAEAQRAQALIDRLACGHACRREHELVDLDARSTDHGEEAGH
jgi:hypothetical protein